MGYCLFISLSFIAIKVLKVTLKNFSSLNKHLFAAVLAEARMCCAGQPVILAGDFNVEPTVIPSLAKISLMVTGLILNKPLLLDEAYPLPLLVSSSLMKIRVLVGISF